MLEKFLDRIEFDSYEDLKANYSVHVPDGFNFAYDVVDDWARIDPGKKALLWCDDNGGRKTYTFMTSCFQATAAQTFCCPQA